jgi:hypothetical protein
MFLPPFEHHRVRRFRPKRLHDPLVEWSLEHAKQSRLAVDITYLLRSRCKAKGSKPACWPAPLAERTALNFLQRLCGVATLTQQYVAAIPDGSELRIADTRKTTPGLRLLERADVRHGGGHNHRDSLSSAIMIKDNHIAAAGSLTEAVKRAKANAPHTSRIEVEVDSLNALDEALAQKVDVLLLTARRSPYSNGPTTCGSMAKSSPASWSKANSEKLRLPLL